MVTIKVTYGPNVHKFTIPVESTWAKFESNLRALFKIPDNFKVIASYTDEDEDIITLSSDIELREVLERHSNYAKTSVKLVLNAIPTSKNITQKEIVETLEGLKIVDDEKCYATETETETEKECDETCNEKCSEEEEETAQSSSDPEIYFFVRSRSRRRPRFGYASFENSSVKCPFRNREFDPHRRHHRQPHGGPFGPFGPHHHGGPHHGGPHHGGPYYGELHHGEPHHRGNRGFHGHPHPPPPPGFMHKRHFGEFEGFGPHGEFGHFGPFGPHHGGHGYGHGHGHGRFRSRRCHGPRCNRETGSEKECHKEEKECKDEKNENVTNDPSVERENHAPSCPPGPSGHAYHGPRSPRRHRSRSRSPVPHDGKEHGNSRMHGHWHGHHPGFHHRRRHHHHHGEVHGHHHHHKQLTPEELAEKVALLNSMNFPADKNEHYENLLKKFHGRIGRVVEILLCERKRKDGEEPGDDNNDGGSDDDDNNDFEEIKEPTSPITSSTV